MSLLSVPRTLRSQQACRTQHKRMLRNSGGLSLLRGRLGVQVVVDNPTIDDSLRAEGWDITKRSMRGQGPVTVQQLARRARKRALSMIKGMVITWGDSSLRRGNDIKTKI